MCKSDLLKALKDSGEEYVWVRNASSEDLDDRSFIQYWINQTHYVFGYFGYLCPAIRQWCKRDKLDGVHVKIVNEDDDTEEFLPADDELMDTLSAIVEERLSAGCDCEEDCDCDSCGEGCCE